MPPTKIRRYLKHGTLSQLWVFEAVARLGNFTRASEELHMAQPTASVQIKKLTETIGLPLFDQVGRKVQLTAAGRALYDSCEDMFATLAAAEDKLADLRGLKTGRLQLAVSATGQYLAPRLLAGFVQRHPGIEIVLQIHNRQTLRERLMANTDDLYLLADPPQSDEVVVQKILPNPLVAFTNVHHPLSKEKHITLERFAQEPFLIREPCSSTRIAMLQLFERYGLKPRIKMELSSNEAIREAILAGLGVSIMSRYTLGLDTTPKDLVILDVEGLPIESHWYLAYPAGKQPSLVAQSFMEFARDHARQIVMS